MTNEETILDNGMSNDYQNENNATNKSDNLSTTEKLAYAAGGAVVGAGATLAGQTIAAPKGEKPEVKKEEPKVAEAQPTEEKGFEGTPTTDKPTEEPKQATEPVQPEHKQATEPAQPEHKQATEPAQPEHKQATEPAQPEHNTEAAIPPADDEVIIEMNGTKVHVEGDATVEIRDGEIRVETVEPMPEPEPEPEPEILITGAGETDLNHDGINEYSVSVEVDGQEVLLVDIDEDGKHQADIAIIDADGNGIITEDEIIDITGEGIELPTIQEIEAYQDSLIAPADDCTAQTDMTDFNEYSLPLE